MARQTRGSAQLWMLAAKLGARRAVQRLRIGPNYQWRFGGRIPDRVLVAPPDLRHADPQIAHDIYSGTFPLAGKVVHTGGQSPFQVSASDRSWLKSLHGFRWLRHMRAAGTELATANARALVADWIATFGARAQGLPWSPGTVARRLIAWLQYSNVILQSADLRFYRSFMRSLVAQTRFLRRAVHGMPTGRERLRVNVALALAALCLPSSASAMRAANRNLSDELDIDILADGTPQSRDPRAVIEILSDLLPLRRTYVDRGMLPPDALTIAIDRLLPVLRFFCHVNGTLAHFNGMGATMHDRVTALLRQDQSAVNTPARLPLGGYDRLVQGDTVVIADTGCPPPAESAGSACAGCLSFEMSSGRSPFVVNCGVDTFGPDELRPLGRSTAAHSTLTLDDTSQARFNHASRATSFVGAPLLGGPSAVKCERNDTSDAQTFVASHDAYLRRFGLYHERTLELAERGRRLTGIDRLYREGERPPASRDQAAVRFHLHPDIDMRIDGAYLILSAKDGMRWRFASFDVPPAVEESLFLAGLMGPRRSRQIVLLANAAETPTIRWRFECIAA